eukprot:CAMPEP_0194215250 /NCGR_PEP_ID=MMETSP0156-20130528/16929_1 /TAXON_ID=33649 /ORGANISM="Thalassionema nitzschioides, Strain L26-B" /LENGTH=73 /DNA_ID=CAMNT_0038943717 /DNA_START=67 /DNA_END=288 /DNA_ORIENTATION=-
MGCSPSTSVSDNNNGGDDAQSSTLPAGKPRSDEDFQKYLQETQARLDAENAKKEQQAEPMAIDLDDDDKSYWA